MDPVGRPALDGLLQELAPLLDGRRDAALTAILVNLHPADIAALLAALGDEDDRRYLFQRIPDPETASAVLSELSPPVAEDITGTLHHDELADLVEEMDSDDAADLIQQLPEEIAARVLLGIEPTELAAMRPLLGYAEDTAGGIMATEVLTVNQEATVGDARNQVRAHRDDAFFFVYVVDDQGRLKGAVSLKDMVLARSDRPVREAMNPEPIAVMPSMDQEEVADIVRRYDLVSVPVVDGEGTLLGRITIDDVVDVIREEAEEDIARMAGTDDEEFDESSVRRIAALRLPWILTSLFGGLLAGAVLRHYTGSMGAVALFLVAFVPVITAMGGNAGGQAAITMVRRLALHRIGFRQMVVIVYREARIGLLLGLTSAVIVGATALLWRGSAYYGLVVGVAMATAILVAATLGAIVPLVLHRLRVDPAIATGPFVSMSNDVIGLFIYFGLATLLLRLGFSPSG